MGIRLTGDEVGILDVGNFVGPVEGELLLGLRVGESDGALDWVGGTDG